MENNSQDQIPKAEGDNFGRSETLVRFFVGYGQDKFSNPALAAVKQDGSKLIFIIDFGLESTARAISDIVKKIHNGEMDNHPAKLGTSPYFDFNKLKETDFNAS